MEHLRGPEEAHGARGRPAATDHLAGERVAPNNLPMLDPAFFAHQKADEENVDQKLKRSSKLW